MMIKSRRAALAPVAPALALLSVALLGAASPWRYAGEVGCRPTLPYAERMFWRKVLDYPSMLDGGKTADGVPSFEKIYNTARSTVARRDATQAKMRASGYRVERRLFTPHHLAPSDAAAGRPIAVDMLATNASTSRDVLLVFDGGAYCLHDAEAHTDIARLPTALRPSPH